MALSNTIPLVYNGGSYGTYLEWVLTSLTTEGEITAPFTKNGSSHNFAGNNLVDMSGWRRYLESDLCHKFVRFHPKTSKHESLSDNLTTVAQRVDKMIYIYPDPQSKLLVLNNWFFKVWDDWWNHQFMSDIDQDYIYDNWPISRDQDIRYIPRWIKREFLSFYLVPAWHDQVEWYHPQHWHDTKCLILSVSNLLYDFESTLSKISQFCDLKFIKDPVVMGPVHNEMLTKQQYLDRDQICHNIVDNIINQIDYDWSELSLASESWLQWQLRNLHYEIHCHDLDKLPTNSLQLRELLYNP